MVCEEHLAQLEIHMSRQYFVHNLSTICTGSRLNFLSETVDKMVIFKH